jgi:hypothetical protein
MARQVRQRAVHLVGSVPLANEEDVFHAASTTLGDCLKRIPDGETGVRANWIGWQAAVFARNPSLEAVPVSDKDYGLRVRYRLRPSTPASAVTFANLGYAAATLASYETFARLRQAGTIARSTRFQVCLPTPLAPVTSFLAPESRAAVEPAYEAQLLAELTRICAVIPHDQLAIQWDTAIEFGILEGVMPTHLADPQREIIDRLVRLGAQVPADIELGYHLCYGDAGHRHFVQPQDTSRLVTVANAICAGVKRPVNWIHLPVPRDRDDEAYYAPLKNLRLHPEAELYLGLVHYTDGLAGTRRRMATAAKVVPAFGIATECGFGRRPAETVTPLLQLHREAAESAATSDVAQ